jgi:trimethylamine:corrinoid methyltransferase-like protein
MRLQYRKTPSHDPGFAPGGELLLAESEVGGILQTAYEVIGEIGIEVPDADLRERVLSSGGTARGTRITFSRDEVAAYLLDWRKRRGSEGPGWPREVGWPYDAKAQLDLHVMPYGHTYLDPASGRHVPLTAARLREATRFLGTFHGQQVQASVPGHATDIPAARQPLQQYKTGAQHNPAGGGYGWMGPPATAEHLFRMAEIMSRPIRSTVVYVCSPLRLGGDELTTAIAFRKDLTEVHVGNMGSCGASLPLFPKAALGLAWAETIAGAMCVEALTGLPTSWGASIEPFDLRANTIPFGAPEQVLFYRLSREANAWVRRDSPLGGCASLLTMAKQPGAQAMMEKALAGAVGLSFGCTSLGAGGSLSADEVFSPVQLVLDCELRDWLRRVAQGASWPEDTADTALAMIREAVEGGSFAAAETTLEHYREVYWFPRHLRREMLSAWQALGGPDAVDGARQEALQRLETATWVLPEPRFSRLEAVYEEACRKLGGAEGDRAG